MLRYGGQAFRTLHSTVLTLPGGEFPSWEGGGSFRGRFFVPEGQDDNSPLIHRWDHWQPPFTVPEGRLLPDMVTQGVLSRNAVDVSPPRVKTRGYFDKTC